MLSEPNDDTTGSGSGSTGPVTPPTVPATSSTPTWVGPVILGVVAVVVILLAVFY